MSGAVILAGRRPHGTVRDMLSPNVIEIRRGSAHCLAVESLALPPTSAPPHYVSRGGAAQLAVHDVARPVLERAA